MLYMYRVGSISTIRARNFILKFNIRDILSYQDSAYTDRRWLNIRIHSTYSRISVIRAYWDREVTFTIQNSNTVYSGPYFIVIIFKAMYNDE